MHDVLAAAGPLYTRLVMPCLLPMGMPSSLGVPLTFAAPVRSVTPSLGLGATEV